MPIKLDKIAVFCLRDEYLPEILNAAFSYFFFMMPCIRLKHTV